MSYQHGSPSPTKHLGQNKTMESVFEARARAIDCYAEIKDVIDAAKTQEDLRIMEKKFKAMKAEFEALNSK